MQLGEKIRQFRQGKGLTLEDLAFAAETDAGNLSRIERGLQACGAEMLIRIAAALAITPNELLSAESKKVLSDQPKLRKTRPEKTDGTGMPSGIQNRLLSLTPENQSLVFDFIRLLQRRQTKETS